MVKRREKSEKTSMLDRQIKKVVERIIAYDILERRYWSRFTRNGKVFYRDMSWSLKGAAKEDRPPRIPRTRWRSGIWPGWR
mgnify:CR=1 FL=1